MTRRDGRRHEHAEVQARRAVPFGRAGNGILAVAESSNSDLIILGRSGAGAVRAAFLGSTVSAVVHGATCPVLVVTESLDHIV